MQKFISFRSIFRVPVRTGRTVQAVRSVQKRGPGLRQWRGKCRWQRSLSVQKTIFRSGITQKNSLPIFRIIPIPTSHLRHSALIREVEQVKDVVEVSISTRPDCLGSRYLAFLHEWMQKTGICITIELGLQTANYHTLLKVNRGHSLAEYVDAVQRIRQYPFDICTHVILNLPWDDRTDVAETAKLLSVLGSNIVKIHSLYLAKGTVFAKQYERGEFQICTLEEYMERLILFLRLLDPEIVVERFFSRIPKEDAVFCNWGASWWKLKELVEKEMRSRGVCQGDMYAYRDGAKLGKWNKP